MLVKLIPDEEIGKISLDEREKEKQEQQFATTFDIIKDYSEYSTIQGLVYIFLSHQTVFGRVFWSMVKITTF
jgi:hypothetical protein